MDLEKLKPWNWFKHEENENSGAQRVPVRREQAEHLPLAGAPSLMNLHREMERLFDDAAKSFGMAPLGSRFEPRRLLDGDMAGFFRPKIDVCGDDKCYEISLDLPGLEQEDLTLELRDDMLVIKGHKQERSEDKQKHYYRVERSYGSFQRRLALPDDADADRIKASLDKGVLKLEIPRKSGAEKDVKRIAISS